MGRAKQTNYAIIKTKLKLASIALKDEIVVYSSRIENRSRTGGEQQIAAGLFNVNEEVAWMLMGISGLEK